MPTQQKKPTKKIIFLLIIIFSHIFPVILSAFYDQATHPSHNVKLTELKYWLWAFTWWSAWTSLLTAPWAIYKIFASKRKKSGFGEQIWDLIVAETNLLSGVIFCGGGFCLTLHTAFKKPVITYPLLGDVKTIYIWLFYNSFWHVLAPGLVFYYFWKYCRVDKLAKKKWLGLVANLSNPTIYLCYLMLRPLISNFSKPAPSFPHKYPPDYPYPPFFWIRGEYANGTEQRAGRSKFLFCSWQPSWQAGIVWLIITVVFWYTVFSILAHFLVKFKLRRDHLSQKNNPILSLNWKK
ncbi:MAG: hypothetical protein MRERV_52c008 [Mycoplasmataceae bacterium RV_VA103A]|nr:MAG: hypothetical protein MRERV_52c008 [Mycoplasmataceae bacterium RV_VA103A]